jgi:hypothetical protein
MTIQALKRCLMSCYYCCTTHRFKSRSGENVHYHIVMVPPSPQSSRQDKTRQGETRQDKTRQYTTLHDTTRQDKTRQNKIRQDKTRSELSPTRVRTNPSPFRTNVSNEKAVNDISKVSSLLPFNSSLRQDEVKMI